MKQEKNAKKEKKVIKLEPKPKNKPSKKESQPRFINILRNARGRQYSGD